MLYQNILNTHQQFLLGKLDLQDADDFYLAGGTALALQIGHRTSVDFDFYSKEPFDNLELLASLQEQISDLTVQSQEEKTLRVFSQDTEVSFFVYPYPLIRPTVQFDQLKLASKEDIAAMKLIAIVQRGTQRDFVDIYFLLQEFSLRELLSFATQKFAGYQEMLFLKALVFFDDAENTVPQSGVRVLKPDYSWQKAKAYVIAEVKKYQLEMGGLNP
ncbi:MAG TPA: nucleotidyl transferase AbiEii/AbiGii toxin family protein [Thermoguttaceae bacterium]